MLTVILSEIVAVASTPPAGALARKLAGAAMAAASNKRLSGDTTRHHGEAGKSGRFERSGLGPLRRQGVDPESRQERLSRMHARQRLMRSCQRWMQPRQRRWRGRERRQCTVHSSIWKPKSKSPCALVPRVDFIAEALGSRARISARNQPLISGRMTLRSPQVAEGGRCHRSSPAGQHNRWSGPTPHAFPLLICCSNFAGNSPRLPPAAPYGGAAGDSRLIEAGAPSKATPQRSSWDRERFGAENCFQSVPAGGRRLHGRTMDELGTPSSRRPAVARSAIEFDEYLANQNRRLTGATNCRHPAAGCAPRAFAAF